MNSSTLIYHRGLPHLSLKYAQKCCVFDNKRVENLSHFSFKHSILVSFLLRPYNYILTERTDWCVCERACVCAHACVWSLPNLFALQPIGIKLQSL